MSKRTKEGDEIQRKKRARLRFKRIVRVAQANCQWITEMEEQGITLNVKKNVAMLVRKKHKTGILTMAQKGLLAAPHHTRTISERKKLCTIVAALGCFTQIPPKIRARLVPYLQFMSVGSNRLLMKEGDVPTVVYFVVSGEVEMSRKIYNKITRTIYSKPEAFCGPGDWIGEVEVLESELRLNTYRTTNTCELLILHDSDFNTILKPYVKKVWVEKKKAIASLSYLKFMNEAQIISACKFGIIRQYDPLDTIYPEEKDSILYVHFVLSGECVLLQCLRMKKLHVKGEMQYELTEIVNEDTDSEAEDDKPEPFDVRELLRSSSSLDEQGANKKKAKRKAEFAKIEQNCLLLNQKAASTVAEPMAADQPVHHVHMRSSSRSVTSITKHKHRRKYTDYDYEDDEFEDFEDVWSEDTTSQSFRASSLRMSRLNRQSRQSKQSSRPSKLSLQREVEAESESRESEIFTVSPSTSSSPTTSLKTRPIEDDENYATHFIDIGSMYFGGVFGAGEKCDHRVVMARTTVQCLLIPRYWLMEDDQNPGHMWQRMRFYLDRCIPSRETLFSDFIKTRKWAHFKYDCVEELTHSTTNPTKVEDIPIIIRILEPNSDS